MSGASPHAGNNVSAGCLKCKVGLANGATFCETIPAVGGKAVHRETDDHNDNVYKHQPIGEVRASGRGEGRGGKGGRKEERRGESREKREGGREGGKREGKRGRRGREGGKGG